jgi:ribonuclease BN (tRNA processing enzyme)
MNDLTETHSAAWENDEARVDVLFSAAGVATNIAMVSKFSGSILLADVGDGTLRDLLSQGSLDFVNELNLIIITHGHFDHMGGLYSLLGFLRMLKRSTPLDILIPKGCKEVSSTIRTFKDIMRPFRSKSESKRWGTIQSSTLTSFTFVRWKWNTMDRRMPRGPMS